MPKKPYHSVKFDAFFYTFNFSTNELLFLLLVEANLFWLYLSILYYYQYLQIFDFVFCIQLLLYHSRKMGRKPGLLCYWEGSRGHPILNYSFNRVVNGTWRESQMAPVLLID